MVWDTGVARGPEQNIRTWGQLGLTGEWADAPIVPYGPAGLHPGGQSFFQQRVMGGADLFNEATREYADRNAMVADMINDRFGIGYGSLGYARPGVRAIPIADGSNRAFVALTRKSVTDRSYPLTRSAYIYAAPDSAAGDAAMMEPRLLAFLQYALSPAGQRLVAPTGFNPLPATMAAEQAARIQEKPQVYRVDE